MLMKSLEFKNVVGHKVKIMEIPVLEASSPYYFLVQTRLEAFIRKVSSIEQYTQQQFSFREYLKKAAKWTVYEQIYQTPRLKNNA